MRTMCARRPTRPRRETGAAAGCACLGRLGPNILRLRRYADEPAGEPHSLDLVAIERLVAAYRLLADPGRLRLVGALLEDRELPVRELARLASLSETAASQQLRGLREAGVVRRRRAG